MWSQWDFCHLPAGLALGDSLLGCLIHVAGKLVAAGASGLCSSTHEHLSTGLLACPLWLVSLQVAKTEPALFVALEVSPTVTSVIFCWSWELAPIQ